MLDYNGSFIIEAPASGPDDNDGDNQDDNSAGAGANHDDVKIFILVRRGHLNLRVALLHLRIACSRRTKAFALATFLKLAPIRRLRREAIEMEKLAEAWPPHAHNVVSEIKMQQETTAAMNKTESKAGDSPTRWPRENLCGRNLL